MLTDGEVMSDGAAWLAPGATRLGPSDTVLFDLGTVRELIGVAIQADNNDDYFVDVSTDAQTWNTWYRAGPVGNPGLQTRKARLPMQPARYLRLRAQGGDGNFSVSELEVFTDSMSGSALLRPWWQPTHPFDIEWLWLVAGVTAFLLVVNQRTTRPMLVLLGSVTAFGAFYVLRDTFIDTVVDGPRLNFLRGAVGLLAAGAVLRLLVLRTRAPANELMVNVVLGVSAVLGVLCFLNLGRPQFHDAGQGRSTYLHHYDMRTYYPIAKYFPELRFDGVYAASALVVAQDHGGLDAMAGQRFRDLRTHEDTTVGAAREHIEQVRARFTPERWASFVEDMRYFRNAMGDGGFLGSMNDHGGNATPVWFLTARLIFFGAKASDATLWVGVILDAALLLLAFVGLYRGFGVRTALVGMTVFGAMDFYQFGSNWFGAALRHDWLALWCLSLWALKTGRPRLGGALLAWSALIRAFPALGFVTLTIPVLWDALAAVRAKTFSLKTFVQQHRDFVQVVIGAAIATVVLVGLSLVFFGLEAWPEWFRKVSLLDRDGHLNNLAVRTYLTQTKPEWLAVVAVAFASMLVVARNARPEIAVAWGVVLVPIVFNPANYYLHSMFLLVVLAGESPKKAPGIRGLLSWLVLLLMCTASAYTNLPSDIGVHFRYDTYVVLTTVVVLVALFLTQRAPAAGATSLAP